MAKKTTSPTATDRQAKIQAASKKTGGGANKIVVGAVVLIVAIVAVVGAVVWQQQSARERVTAGGNAVPAGTQMGQGFRAFADVTAAPNAPRVDLFVDFQCPACKQFETALSPTFRELAQEGKITLVYHVKNFLDDNLGNDASTRAAIGAFCAADAGAFEKYLDLVYENQPSEEGQGWTDAQLTDFAKGAGLSGDALSTWQQCFDLRKYEKYVNSVEQQSFADGVRGTPTFKINGVEQKLQDFAGATDTGKVYDPAKLVAAIQAATK